MHGPGGAVPALAARGQALPASGVEGGPVWDWPVGAAGGGRGGRSAPSGHFLVTDTRLGNGFWPWWGRGVNVPVFLWG